MEDFALGLNLLFRVITEHIGWYDMKYFICEMTSVLLGGAFFNYVDKTRVVGSPKMLTVIR